MNQIYRLLTFQIGKRRLVALVPFDTSGGGGIISESELRRRVDHRSVSLLRSLRGDTQLRSDSLPRDSRPPRCRDCFGDLTLATCTAHGRTSQQVLGHIDLIIRGWLVVLKLRCQLIGMVKDVLY